MDSEDPADPAPSLHILEIAGNALVGGMERHVELLVGSLVGQGHKISALCPFESGLATALRAMGCEVRIAAVEDALPWRSLLVATDLVRRRQVDLVHTHLFNATFLGSLSANLLGVPSVMTVHGMNISPEEVAIARLTGSHLVTVCTAAYYLGLSLGLPEEQISLIPNGVDVETYHPRTDGHLFRQELGVPDTAPLVGMVGRLAAEKGPDLFIRAAGLVAAARPDVHFVLVGDGSLRYEVAAQVAELGLAERIHLVGLMADTSRVYPALDVVCLASRMEGQPLAVLEAMACGRPLVASAVGGVPEMVQMGETGWLVPSGDTALMGERILWLLSHPEQSSEMGRAARRRAVEVFDARKQAETIGRLFRRLVAQRRPQALATLHMGAARGQVRVL